MVLPPSRAHHRPGSPRAGGIGQPLSLLLKLNKDVTDLRLYDIRGAPGVGADLSHIDTPAVVRLPIPLALGRPTGL